MSHYAYSLPHFSYSILRVYLSTNTLYTTLNCRAALHFNPEVYMKVNDMPVSFRSFHTFLGALLLILLLCSCSLSGSTPNTTTATSKPTPAPTPKGVPTQSPKHPIANQPPGAGNNGGTPLPANEVKPL